MKVSDLKNTIKSSLREVLREDLKQIVKECISEEMKDILLEALKSKPGNSINEGYTLNNQSSNNYTPDEVKSKIRNAVQFDFNDILKETAVNSNQTGFGGPINPYEEVPEGGLPKGEVDLSQITKMMSGGV